MTYLTIRTISHGMRVLVLLSMQITIEPTDHGVRLPESIANEVLGALTDVFPDIIVTPGRWCDDAWRMTKKFPGPVMGDTTFGDIKTVSGGTGGIPSDTWDPRRFGGLFRMLQIANEGNGHLAAHYSDRFERISGTLEASWETAWMYGLIKIGSGVTHDGYVSSLEGVGIDLAFVAPMDGEAAFKNYTRLTIGQLRGWAVNIAIEKSGVAIPSYCLGVCTLGLTEARFLWFALLEGLLHYEFEGIIHGVGISIPDASDDIRITKGDSKGATMADTDAVVVTESRSKRSRSS